jgi:polysaccharide biosynthesis transport protein
MTTGSDVQSRRESLDLDLGNYLRVVRKWWWLILACVALAGGISYWVSQSMPSAYRASATLMVGDRQISPNVTMDKITTSQRLAAIYADMARREPVLQAAVDALGLRTSWWELRDRVLASSTAGSQFITVWVTDGDPNRAKATVDEIIRQLIVHSPTAELERQSEQRQQFVQEQLDTLQSNIEKAELSVAAKQDAIERESSARGVLDLQDEIRALRLNIDDWRRTYSSLLGSYEAKAPSTLTVIEPAFVPGRPISPDVRSNMLMAGALGLLLALAAAFVLESVAGTLDTDRDVRRALGLATLGRVKHLAATRGPSASLSVLRSPGSEAAESYRSLRVGVQLACTDCDTIVLLVASPSVRGGEAAVTANLAASFALAGARTVLVDADLRSPSLHALLGASNEVGLSSLLAWEPLRWSPGPKPANGRQRRHPARVDEDERRQQIERFLVPTEVPGLSLLPSGPAGANPELLGSSRMSEILRTLGGDADVVVLLGAPALSSADTVVLAGMGLNVLLSLEAGKTPVSSARLASERLLSARANILGVVLSESGEIQLGQVLKPLQEARSWSSLWRSQASQVWQEPEWPKAKR